MCVCVSYIMMHQRSEKLRARAEKSCHSRHSRQAEKTQHPQKARTAHGGADGCLWHSYWIPRQAEFVYVTGCYVWCFLAPCHRPKGDSKYF